jgi:hypothetical protein
MSLHAQKPFAYNVLGATGRQFRQFLVVSATERLREGEDELTISLQQSVAPFLAFVGPFAATTMNNNVHFHPE